MTEGVEIIIVSHNTRADLAACLDSLRVAPPARITCASGMYLWLFSFVWVVRSSAASLSSNSSRPS